MLITRIEAIPVRIPVHPPRKSSLGTFDAYEYAIVRVYTDSGVEGIGEISTLWDGAAAVQCALVEHALAPALIGLDPRRINEGNRRMRLLKESGMPARAGIEMALFDIAGKAANVPVHDLLGGTCRDRIALSRSIHMAPLADMTAAARRFVDEGFTCIKVKIGRDLASDVAVVHAIREAIGPDVLLRVDANMAWRSAKDAARAIDKLTDANLHSVEQPIPPGNIDEMRLLRTLSPVPIMADESVWGPEDAWNLLKAGAVDMFNIYVSESGGLSNAASIFRMAELADVTCVIGAMPELGIGTAAAIHLGLSVGNLDDPCDASGAMYHTDDVVLESFDLRDGSIAAPDGPGLGVTLDMAQIERFRVRT